MANTNGKFNINGYVWEDVTDRTTTGDTYNIRDVVTCGGQKPWLVSVEKKLIPMKEKIKLKDSEFFNKRRKPND